MFYFFTQLTHYSELKVDLLITIFNPVKTKPAFYGVYGKA